MLSCFSAFIFLLIAVSIVMFATTVKDKTRKDILYMWSYLFFALTFMGICSMVFIGI